MGQNLALIRYDDHLISPRVYLKWRCLIARTTRREVKNEGRFIAANPPDTQHRPQDWSDAKAFRIWWLRSKPRKIIILVKAGPAVDAVTKQLIEAGAEKDDLIVDYGMSQWTDTIRREKEFSDRCRFFGSGFPAEKSVRASVRR